MPQPLMKAETEWFYEDLQDLLELTPNPPPQKTLLLIMEYKNRMLRDTLRNRYVWS